MNIGIKAAIPHVGVISQELGERYVQFERYTKSQWHRAKQGASLASVAAWMKSRGYGILYFSVGPRVAERRYVHYVLIGPPGQGQAPVEAFKREHGLVDTLVPGVERTMNNSKQRGRVLYHNGAVTVQAVVDHGDWALFAGSCKSSNEGGEYAVTVGIKDDELTQATCTCPHYVDGAARVVAFDNDVIAAIFPACKHVVAMYLEARYGQ